MIEWQLTDSLLPVLAIPRKGQPSSTDLQMWLMATKDEVLKYLSAHGAILFRGFRIRLAKEFQDIASIFCDGFSDYVGGNSPRTKVTSHVFTSTEYANDQRISMHNEASYLKQMPKTILFFCQQPAASGGETPLADCRLVLDHLEPLLRSRFEQKGVLYVNNMHAGGGLGRSWMDAFGTTDRHEVERLLHKDGYKYEWQSDGGLRTFASAPGILCHPKTLEDVWINQAEQWHPSSLDKNFREQLLSLIREDELPHNSYFGDGSPLDEEELDKIRTAMDSEERIFHWQKGDVLLCDNYLVMHGRKPYSGDRKILVAMG